MACILTLTILFAIAAVISAFLWSHVQQLKTQIAQSTQRQERRNREFNVAIEAQRNAVDLEELQWLKSNFRQLKQAFSQDGSDVVIESGQQQAIKDYIKRQLRQAEWNQTIHQTAMRESQDMNFRKLRQPLEAATALGVHHTRNIDSLEKRFSTIEEKIGALDMEAIWAYLKPRMALQNAAAAKINETMVDRLEALEKIVSEQDAWMEEATEHLEGMNTIENSLLDLLTRAGLIGENSKTPSSKPADSGQATNGATYQAETILSMEDRITALEKVLIEHTIDPKSQQKTDLDMKRRIMAVEDMMIRFKECSCQVATTMLAALAEPGAKPTQASASSSKVMPSSTKCCAGSTAAELFMFANSSASGHFARNALTLGAAADYTINKEEPADGFDQNPSVAKPYQVGSNAKPADDDSDDWSQDEYASGEDSDRDSEDEEFNDRVDSSIAAGPHSLDITAVDEAETEKIALEGDRREGAAASESEDEKKTEPDEEPAEKSKSDFGNDDAHDYGNGGPGAVLLPTSSDDSEAGQDEIEASSQAGEDQASGEEKQLGGAESHAGNDASKVKNDEQDHAQAIADSSVRTENEQPQSSWGVRPVSLTATIDDVPKAEPIPANNGDAELLRHDLAPSIAATLAVGDPALSTAHESPETVLDRMSAPMTPIPVTTIVAHSRELSDAPAMNHEVIEGATSPIFRQKSISDTKTGDTDTKEAEVPQIVFSGHEFDISGFTVPRASPSAPLWPTGSIFNLDHMQAGQSKQPTADSNKELSSGLSFGTSSSASQPLSSQVSESFAFTFGGPTLSGDGLTPDLAVPATGSTLFTPFSAPPTEPAPPQWDSNTTSSLFNPSFGAMTWNGDAQQHAPINLLEAFGDTQKLLGLFSPAADVGMQDEEQMQQDLGQDVDMGEASSDDEMDRAFREAFQRLEEEQTSNVMSGNENDDMEDVKLEPDHAATHPPPTLLYGPPPSLPAGHLSPMSNGEPSTPSASDVLQSNVGYDVHRIPDFGLIENQAFQSGYEPIQVNLLKENELGFAAFTQKNSPCAGIEQNQAQDNFQIEDQPFISALPGLAEAYQRSVDRSSSREPCSSQAHVAMEMQADPVELGGQQKKQRLQQLKKDGSNQVYPQYATGSPSATISTNWSTEVEDHEFGADQVAWAPKTDAEIEAETKYNARRILKPVSRTGKNIEFTKTLPELHQEEVLLDEQEKDLKIRQEISGNRWYDNVSFEEAYAEAKTNLGLDKDSEVKSQTFETLKSTQATDDEESTIKDDVGEAIAREWEKGDNKWYNEFIDPAGSAKSKKLQSSLDYNTRSGENIYGPLAGSGNAFPPAITLPLRQKETSMQLPPSNAKYGSEYSPTSRIAKYQSSASPEDKTFHTSLPNITSRTAPQYSPTSARSTLRPSVISPFSMASQEPPQPGMVLWQSTTSPVQEWVSPDDRRAVAARQIKEAQEKKALDMVGANDPDLVCSEDEVFDPKLVIKPKSESKTKSNGRGKQDAERKLDKNFSPDEPNVEPLELVSEYNRLPGVKDDVPQRYNDEQPRKFAKPRMKREGLPKPPDPSIDGIHEVPKPPPRTTANIVEDPEPEQKPEHPTTMWIFGEIEKDEQGQMKDTGEEIEDDSEDGDFEDVVPQPRQQVESMPEPKQTEDEVFTFNLESGDLVYDADLE